MFLLMYLQAFSVLTTCFAHFSMTDVARLSGSMPASSFVASGYLRAQIGSLQSISHMVRWETPFFSSFFLEKTIMGSHHQTTEDVTLAYESSHEVDISAIP